MLSAGFSRVNVTPPMGIPLAGYYQTRLAAGVLDDLEVNALALAAGDDRALLISVDHLGLEQRWMDPIRRRLARETGTPLAGVFVACTHTHTAPLIRQADTDAEQRDYLRFLESRMLDAARFALNDLRPAKLGWGVGRAPGIAFSRRFRMRDGSLRTNPGVNHPDILAPVGTPDESVGVVRLDRPGAETLVLAHFGVHPDTVGGCLVSADWPGFARRFTEQALDNTRCLVLNGAQGDLNHVNTAPRDGDLNDLTPDFDDVMRGYGHARHMGRVVAGAVMQVYDKVRSAPVSALGFLEKTLLVPANLPAPEELPLARRYVRLHRENRDGEIPFTGMMLTTVVAEAERMLQLEHGPAEFPLRLSVLALGEVAFLGIPGEPFAAVGRALRGAAGWPLVLPCCCANGDEGYFPTLDAYNEGGYEARSSIFRAGVAEKIIREGTALLDRVKNPRKGGTAHVE